MIIMDLWLQNEIVNCYIMLLIQLNIIFVRHIECCIQGMFWRFDVS